jgi:hypothetical protein
MEGHSPDVVEVPFQGEQTTSLLEVPELDSVVVSSTHEQRLSRMEADPSYRSFMLHELVKESAYAVVPQLDSPAVKGHENPMSGGVEAEALDPRAFVLKLKLHYKWSLMLVEKALRSSLDSSRRLLRSKFGRTSLSPTQAAS